MSSTTLPARTTLAAAALAVATAALAAGCSGGTPAGAPAARPPAAAGSSTAPAAPAPGSATASRPAPVATRTPPARPVPARRPTAADSLAAFFAAAEADDARIRAAARAVSRGFGPTTVHFSRADRAVVQAARPDRTAVAIPAGLDPELQRAVLIVYNDLVTRAAAFRPVWELPSEPVSRSTVDVERFLRPLRLGSAVARAFPADLAAARALAAARPPVPAVRPDSRAAAELTIRISYIQRENIGCGASGAPVRRDLAPIVWTPVQTVAGTADGHVRGIPFTARYGERWTADLLAC